MTMPEPTNMLNNSKPRRRWLQFSVRTFLILVTVFCVWLGIHANRARKQKAAVNMIENHGGGVYYDYYDLDVQGRSSSIPGWLINLFGEDFFHDVWFVYSHTKSNDEKLSAKEFIPVLQKLPDLRFISLTHDSASDELLEVIGNLKHLRELGLINADKITDKGIAKIEQCTSLVGVNISSKTTTDEVARSLSKLPNLTSVVLDGNQYTDKALFYLKESNTLKEIRIFSGDRKPKITDIGLGYVEQMKNLKLLNVRNMQKSPGNEGANRLRKMLPNLKLVQ